MSDNTYNIGNSVYKFSFSLAKLTGDENTTSIIPLPKSCVKYLSIDDNLANMGYTGMVMFTNFSGILEKLGLGTGLSDGTTLFDVNIENLDFQSTNLQDNSINAVMTLQENTDTANNTVDKVMLYNFEEYSVNLLKQQKTKLKFAPSLPISTLIEQLILTCFDYKQNICDKESFKAFTSERIAISKVISKDMSTFECIRQLYRFLLYKGEYQSPALLQLENYINSDGKVARRYVLQPLFKKIRKLITALNQPGVNQDVRDTILERFTIGGESDIASFRDNVIGSFTLLRPDFNTLYNEKWLDYTGVTSPVDLTNTKNISVKYQDLKQSFENNALVNSLGATSNLPVRADVSGDTQKGPREKILAFNYNIEELGQDILVDGITSMVHKSFIYDNNAIVFTVLGNPYRKPGSFIQLHGCVPDNNNNDTSGYWYVIGIKHIFENEIYSNEITAVKIFIRDLTNNRSKPNTSRKKFVTPAVEPAPINENQNFVDPNNTTVYPSDTPQLPTIDEAPIDANEDTNLLPPLPTGDSVPPLPAEASDSTDGPSSTLFPGGEPVTDATIIPDNQQQSTEVDPADVDMDFGTIPEGVPFTP